MNKNTPRIITGYSSIFLDSLRIVAALIVLYFHAYDQWFPKYTNLSHAISNLAHSAVVVFFVLSGYVIAYTSNNKNRGGMQYAQARLSRLFSIVIPVLILTMLIELFVKHYDAILYVNYSRGASLPRYILSSLFLNEIWFFSAAPPFNSPLWSLSFEFWYYIIFGLCFFRKKGFVSIILIFMSCLIAGPKILLMMPIWLLGYFAYSIKKPSFSNVNAWLFVFTGLFLACLIIEFMPSYPYAIGFKPLYFANQFVTDWAIGIFIALSLWVLPSNTHFKKPNKWSNHLRKIADLTFPLYVLHFPLIIFWRTMLGYKINDVIQMWEIIIPVFFSAFLIGLVLEKQRYVWNNLFKWFFSLKIKLSKVS